MSIILRTLKGSALTYEEMDRNMSQFFYSSSLHNEGTTLRLWFTGSNSLDLPGEDYSSRYQELNINTGDINIPESIAAGNNTEIQFNENGTFGAKNTFVFNRSENNLGIGLSNPATKIDVSGEVNKSAEITLRGFTSPGNGILSMVTFNEGSTNIGKIGRKQVTDNDIYLSALSSNKIKFEINTSTVSTVTGTGLGIGTTSPTQKLSIVSTNTGIGVGRLLNQQNIIRPLPNTIPGNVDGGTRRLFPVGAQTEGMLIETPNTIEGGSIVVALNTDSSENEGFNIIKSRQSNYTDTTNTGLIATFRADGKVGINTNTPQDTGLTVAGNISGSGTLQVETINTGTANNTSALVTTSTGLLQKIDAAPIPKGGIILWSGAIGNIPTGWGLCDGGTINGVTTPDLRDKFIVGAGNTYKVDATGGSKDAVVVSHTHTGTTVSGGSHHHFIAHNGLDNTDGLNTTMPMAKQSNSGGELKYALDSFSGGTATVGKTSSHTGHTHQFTTSNAIGGVSGTNKNLPPYYALAYIMYGGV